MTQPIRLSSPIIRRSLATLAVTALLCSTTAQADPPVPFPMLDLPGIFCFRIKDIQRVPGDPESDRFLFEFEVLNWSNTAALGMQFARNIGTGFLGVQQQRPFFAGASVDGNGRPLGSGDDDANFPPRDGTAGSKTGATNDWTVSSQSSTNVVWSAGTPLPFRDLLLAPGPTTLDNNRDACSKIPGCQLVDGIPMLANVETVDNGAPGVDGLADNVLDGFVIDVDDFDPGETLSFNWFLSDGNGMPIGTSGFGNSFGFGTFNIFRVASEAPAVWTRSATASEGPGSNIGGSQNPRDMFTAFTLEGDAFEAEAGAAVTGPFSDPLDNLLDSQVNAELLDPLWEDVFEELDREFRIVVSSDVAGHQNFILMPEVLELVLEILREEQGPMPSGIAEPAQDGSGVQPIRISGPSPWVTVEGTITHDGTISANGAGTVAGFPNTTVTFEGSAAEPAMFQGTYTMGAGGELPTGAPIDYSVTGTMADQGVPLVASILPSTRAAQVGGQPATAFAAIINTSTTATATGVGVGLDSNIPATFSFQTTDPATNAPTGSPGDTPDIPPGGLQTYVFALTPTAPVAPTVVEFDFGGTNTADVDPVPGLNTLQFAASADPIADIVALALTPTGDGILDVPGTTGTGAFVVATFNVGAAATITASADSGRAGLPLDLTICQTDPATGVCLNGPARTVTVPVATNGTPTYAIFAQGQGSEIPLVPTSNRLVVHFRDGDGFERGSTSVAVRTIANPMPTAQ